MQRFRRRFHELAAELQHHTQQVVKTHLDIIHGTMNILRDENIAEESERDEPFRERVANQVSRTQQDINYIRDAIRDTTV